MTNYYHRQNEIARKADAIAAAKQEQAAAAASGHSVATQLTQQVALLSG